MLQDCLNVFQIMYDKTHLKCITEDYMLPVGLYYLYDGITWHFLEIKSNDVMNVQEIRSNVIYQKLCVGHYCSVEPERNFREFASTSTSNPWSFGMTFDKFLEQSDLSLFLDHYFSALQLHMNETKDEYGLIDESIYQQMKQLFLDKLMQLRCDKTLLDRKKKDFKFFCIVDKPLCVFENEKFRHLSHRLWATKNAVLPDGSYGVPCSNILIDKRKKFYQHLSMPSTYPRMISKEDALMQLLFFDYLENLRRLRCSVVYVDVLNKKIFPKFSKDSCEIEFGYALYLKRNKQGLFLSDVNIISEYCASDMHFVLRNFIGRYHKDKHESYAKYDEKYKSYDTSMALAMLLNESCFGFRLFSSEPENENIRDVVVRMCYQKYYTAVRNYGFTGNVSLLQPFVKKGLLSMIEKTICFSREKALFYMNLRWSLLKFVEEGVNIMGDNLQCLQDSLLEKIASKQTLAIESDEEYYFDVGQLAYYLLSRSKSANKTQDNVNTFLNVREDKQLKRKLLNLYRRYNYAIYMGDVRVKNLVAMVMGYQPSGAYQKEIVLIGYACDNLCFRKDNGE